MVISLELSRSRTRDECNKTLRMAGENELGPLEDEPPTILATLSPITALNGLILTFGELQTKQKQQDQILQHM